MSIAVERHVDSWFLPLFWHVSLWAGTQFHSSWSSHFNFFWIFCFVFWLLTMFWQQILIGSLRLLHCSLLKSTSKFKFAIKSALSYWLVLQRSCSCTTSSGVVMTLLLLHKADRFWYYKSLLILVLPAMVPDCPSCRCPRLSHLQLEGGCWSMQLCPAVQHLATPWHHLADHCLVYK